MEPEKSFEQFASTPPTAKDVGKEFIEYSRRRLLREYLQKIERCLKVLSDDDIWWRAHACVPSRHETNNSIGNLILHLSGNVRQWIVSGLGGEADARNRPAEFAEREKIPKEKLLFMLRTTLEDADRVLAAFDSGRLLEVRHIQKYDVTCLDALSHVVEHFAQHLGQIIYITKLRKERDLKFYDL